ncbi:MAG: VWA domain-containing protein [Thiohalomonadales bacterium]
MFEFMDNYLGQFSYFHFLRPWWLLTFFPMLLTLQYLWSRRNSTGKWRNSIAPHLLNVMLVKHGRASWFNPVSISVIAVILGIVALAGPSWKQQPSPFSEDIAALVVILDVSSSMQQQDIQPSRLERAKQKVLDLIALRPGGRLGLIVYAGTAHNVIPLTNDPDVVKNFLSAVNNKMMPRKGKFPEKALPLAEQMLRDSPVPGTILLITDGLSPQTNAEFNNYFSTRQHQLLVFGLGRETTNTSDNIKTEEVLIPLERTALEKLANNSGGSYLSLTLDTSDVKKISRRINSFLVIVDDGSRPWVDAGYYLLYPFVLIMLLWFRKGWTLHWCLVLVLLTGLVNPQPAIASGSLLDQWRFMDWWLTPDQQGQYYMRKGDYKTAAERFENINWRGIAYYRNENFKAAVEMFSRIQTVEGFFNLANALAQGRNYILAVKAYDKVLKLEPTHKSAIKNKKIIQDIINEINLLSESQRQEQGESSKELGKDEPQTADGADRKSFSKKEQKQLTAEDILLDEKMNEIWMQQVQKNPSRFLSIKFHMQLQKQEEKQEIKNAP